MSRLSDVIAQVIEREMGPDGRFDLGAAVSAAMPMLDEEDIHVLAQDTLGRRFKKALEHVKTSLTKVETAQVVLPFENLRSAHALDTQGRYVKLTSELRQIEFRRLIEIRSKQVTDDTAYLKELENAYRAVEPIWHDHPDLTFGSVCEIYGRAAGSARAAS